MTAPMRFILTLLVLVLLTPSADAQDLHHPSDFLGHEIGSRFSFHYQVVDYFEHVASASDRVQLVEYGHTNEGRPLLYAVVSSPENLDRLETIRLNNLRLAGLADGEIDGETAAIVWLSFNVHGNESSGMEASMTTLHALADPTNSESSAWLENTVVMVDPVINPDGRDRYANWYNMVMGASMDTDPEAAEHNEPWPGGRTNHYYFDLNRDWAWQTQIETQQRLPHYQSWMPHVHIDVHEQGYNSPYYFGPAAEPVHEEVTDWQREFEGHIGRNNARYFDSEGWLYFTKEVFDILYPGYGDSFPMFNGAIGMTYEQAGGGSAGAGIETALGDTLTLKDRLTHHTVASLSVVDVTSRMKDRVVEEFATYFEQAISYPPGAYDAYVVSADQSAGRLAALTAHLDRLGISYGAATTSMTAAGFNYEDASTGRQRVEEGDLVIPASQPRAVLTRVLFDPALELSDSLTYDITAWSLPYAYDVDAVAVRTTVEMGDWTPAEATSTVHSDRPVAYVFEWDDASDAIFLSDLIQAGFLVRSNDEAFEVNGHAFDRGSLIVTRRNNEGIGSAFDEKLANMAAAHNQPLVGISTGYVDSGKDLGSSDVRAIRAPRVGMPFGSPISSYGLGEAWYHFDQVLKYPVTRFSAGDFGSIDIDEYDVIVLPSASYGSILGERTLNRVMDWVRGGGTLIAIDRAATWLAGQPGTSLNMKSADQPADSTRLEQARSRRYEDRDRERSPLSNPGAIYRVRVDESHPLGFGFAGESFVLRQRGDHPALMTGSGDWNVGIIQEEGRVSGHTGYQAEDRLEGSLAFGVQNSGRGQIVYLLDNPLFRGFWNSGHLLFANAVFQVGRF